MPEEPQIIIVVKGGVAQEVHSNIPIEYRIIDFDDVEIMPEEEKLEFSNFEQDSIFEDIEEKTKEIITEV